jgi:hypothetical protein
MFLDYRHVCKTCAFNDALQVGKQKEVHPPYSPDLAPADTPRISRNTVNKTKYWNGIDWYRIRCISEIYRLLCWYSNSITQQ